jgi:hypothetical protein
MAIDSQFLSYKHPIDVPDDMHFPRRTGNEDDAVSLDAFSFARREFLA